MARCFSSLVLGALMWLMFRSCHADGRVFVLRAHNGSDTGYAWAREACAARGARLASASELWHGILECSFSDCTRGWMDGATVGRTVCKGEGGAGVRTVEVKVEEEMVEEERRQLDAFCVKDKGAPCGAPPTFPHTHMQSQSGLELGDELRFVCEPGFSLSSGDGAFSLLCDSCGEWYGLVQLCVKDDAEAHVDYEDTFPDGGDTYTDSEGSPRLVAEAGEEEKEEEEERETQTEGTTEGAAGEAGEREEGGDGDGAEEEERGGTEEKEKEGLNPGPGTQPPVSLLSQKHLFWFPSEAFHHHDTHATDHHDTHATDNHATDDHDTHATDHHDDDHDTHATDHHDDDHDTHATDHHDTHATDNHATDDHDTHATDHHDDDHDTHATDHHDDDQDTHATDHHDTDHDRHATDHHDDDQDTHATDHHDTDHHDDDQDMHATDHHDDDHDTHATDHHDDNHDMYATDHDDTHATDHHVTNHDEMHATDSDDTHATDHHATDHDDTHVTDHDKMHTTDHRDTHAKDHHAKDHHAKDHRDTHAKDHRDTHAKDHRDTHAKDHRVTQVTDHKYSGAKETDSGEKEAVDQDHHGDEHGEELPTDEVIQHTDKSWLDGYPVDEELTRSAEAEEEEVANTSKEHEVVNSEELEKDIDSSEEAFKEVTEQPEEASKEVTEQPEEAFKEVIEHPDAPDVYPTFFTNFSDVTTEQPFLHITIDTLNGDGSDLTMPSGVGPYDMSLDTMATTVVYTSTGSTPEFFHHVSPPTESSDAMALPDDITSVPFHVTLSPEDITAEEDLGTPLVLTTLLPDDAATLSSDVPVLIHDISGVDSDLHNLTKQFMPTEDPCELDVCPSSRSSSLVAIVTVGVLVAVVGVALGAWLLRRRQRKSSHYQFNGTNSHTQNFEMQQTV